MNDSSSPNRPARLTQAALPPYSYVTGRFPHPTRDPAGHSFGHAVPLPPPVDPKRWIESEAYLLGCDLFNYGYYWEAHEVWEGLWNACGRHGVTAEFLKGLIKLAAAAVKLREGRPQGTARHGARAAELLQRVRAAIASDTYLGLNVQSLIDFAQALALSPGKYRATDAPVEIVFDLTLVPQMEKNDAGRAAE